MNQIQVLVKGNDSHLNSIAALAGRQEYGAVPTCMYLVVLMAPSASLRVRSRAFCSAATIATSCVSLHTGTHEL